jgi:hypothetical protein
VIDGDHLGSCSKSHTLWNHRDLSTGRLDISDCSLLQMETTILASARLFAKLADLCSCQYAGENSIVQELILTTVYLSASPSYSLTIRTIWSFSR